jgi:hypothetical protein
MFVLEGVCAVWVGVVVELCVAVPFARAMPKTLAAAVPVNATAAVARPTLRRPPSRCAIRCRAERFIASTPFVLS